MKKIIIAALLMLSVAAIANAAGVNAPNTVVGSSHDLSSAGAAGGQICVFCHTPHNADVVSAPLWSHKLSAATYTLYNNADFSKIVSAQPGPVSKACLGCHDGSVAAGYVANGAFQVASDLLAYTPANHGAADPMSGTVGGPNKSIAIGDAMNIGGTADLSTTHPIGITYPAGGNTVFKDPATFAGKAMLLAGATKVECASCHEPHNQGAKEARYFLRSTNDGSALCLTCHIK